MLRCSTDGTQGSLQKDSHEKRLCCKMCFDSWRKDFKAAAYLSCEPTLSLFGQAAAEPLSEWSWRRREEILVCVKWSSVCVWDWERMSDRENMTIVGEKNVCVCVCVKWLKLADMAEGPHTSCLAAHASPFLPLSFPFLPFSSPLLSSHFLSFHTLYSFLSFPFVSVSFLTLAHLPSLLSASLAHSLSLLFHCPSLSLPLCSGERVVIVPSCWTTELQPLHAYGDWGLFAILLSTAHTQWPT